MATIKGKEAMMEGRVHKFNVCVLVSEIKARWKDVLSATIREAQQEMVPGNISEGGNHYSSNNTRKFHLQM